MKKIILLTILSLLSISTYSQELEVKFDDFKGDTLKDTSLERLFSNMKGTAYFRFMKRGGGYTFVLKLMINRGLSQEIFSISEGSELLFKMEDNSVMTLRANESGITTRGGGAKGIVGAEAEGITMFYAIPEKDVRKLSKIYVMKMRVYTNSGYSDYEIKEERSYIIMNAAELILK
jgi:hypothetical protein